VTFPVSVSQTDLRSPSTSSAASPNGQPDRFVTIRFGGGANVVWVNQYGLPGVRVDEAHELG
jgi:hypothetical protein